MSGIQRLYGKCEAKECSKLANGCCQSYAEGDEEMVCAYCSCHRSAHNNYGIIVGGIFHSVTSTPGPSTTPDYRKSSSVVGNPRLPVLADRTVSQAERVQIFRSSVRRKVIDCTSPARGEPGNSCSSAEPAKKKKKVSTLPSKEPPQSAPLRKDPDEWKVSKEVINHRNLLLSWHKGGVNFEGRTDIDLPVVFKINNEPFVPPVSEREDVNDYFEYCFTCYRQLSSPSRTECSSCARYCFSECGGYFSELSITEFLCCFCKNKEQIREEMHSFMDSMPPRYSSHSSLIDFST